MPTAGDVGSDTSESENDGDNDVHSPSEFSSPSDLEDDGEDALEMLSETPKFLIPRPTETTERPGEVD